MELSVEERHLACKGDQKIFEKIVEIHSPWLYNLCYRFNREHHRALDMIQEVFLHIYCRLAQYNPSLPFSPWFRTVSTRKALNLLKKWRTKEWATEEIEPVDQKEEVCFIEQEEGGAKIRETLADLPLRYRVPLVLMYQENRSVREIGDYLGLPENTVKTWLRRGRKEMKKRLEGVLNNE